jgi:hypothetical protein
MVEDGVAFCPHCRAPQIRVLTAEPLAEGVTQTISMLAEGRMPTHPLRTSFVSWPQALPAAALGGVTAIVALMIPLAAWGPAYLAGGAIAVLLYRRRVRVPLATGAGAKIGAASGAFSFLILSIMMLAMYVYHPDELRKGITDSLGQLSARGYDAQGTQQAIDILNNPGGLGFFLVAGMIMLLVVFLAASSIGGALCAAYLRRLKP